MGVRLGTLDASVVFSTPANFDYSVVQTQGMAEAKSLTLVIEATIDGGDTWFMVPATAIGRGQTVTYIWTNGRWFVETFSFDAIRVRVSAYNSGFVTISCSPGEIISGDVPDSLSHRMPVDIGQAEPSPADDRARRLAELASVPSDLKDQKLYGSDNYGSEVR